VCVPGRPLRTWTEFLRELLRVTLAIVEAPVIHVIHVTTHNRIMQRVPWQWEVSADRFIRDVSDEGRTAWAERLFSTKIYDLKEAFKSTREYYRRAQILPFEVSEQMRNDRL
jgi:hypothetical protein